MMHRRPNVGLRGLLDRLTSAKPSVATTNGAGASVVRKRDRFGYLVAGATFVLAAILLLSPWNSSTSSSSAPAAGAAPGSGSSSESALLSVCGGAVGGSAAALPPPTVRRPSAPGRGGVALGVGVVSVDRKVAHYVNRTVHSVFAGMAPAQPHSSVVDPLAASWSSASRAATLSLVGAAGALPINVFVGSSSSESQAYCESLAGARKLFGVSARKLPPPPPGSVTPCTWVHGVTTYDEHAFPNTCVPFEFSVETLDYAGTLDALCTAPSSSSSSSPFSSGSGLLRFLRGAGGASSFPGGRSDQAALVLEDDVEAAPHWLADLEDFLLDRAPRDWEVLTLYVPNMKGIPDFHRRIDSSLDASFYPLTCCTQATVFRCGAKVAALTAGLRSHAHQAPKDHLLRRLVRDLKMPSYVHVPHLFQHDGPLSSLGDRPTHRSELTDFRGALKPLQAPLSENNSMENSMGSAIARRPAALVAGEPYGEPPLPVGTVGGSGSSGSGSSGSGAGSSGATASGFTPSLFFLHTGGALELTEGEKCAVRSAAKHANYPADGESDGNEANGNAAGGRPGHEVAGPRYRVVVLSNSLDVEKFSGLGPVRLEQVTHSRVFRGTPLEAWYKAFRGRKGADPRMFDTALPLALLFTHGGAYLDLSVASLEPLGRLLAGFTFADMSAFGGLGGGAPLATMALDHNPHRPRVLAMSAAAPGNRFLGLALACVAARKSLSLSEKSVSTCLDKAAHDAYDVGSHRDAVSLLQVFPLEPSLAPLEADRGALWGMYFVAPAPWSAMERKGLKAADVCGLA